MIDTSTIGFQLKKVYKRRGVTDMSKYEVKGKLGTGERFARLKKTLKGRKGVYNPKGLAAWIGRRKYGAKKMGQMAAAGRKRG